MAVMSFRRFVHLVVDDMGLRRTYSLRSIDMSHLFRSPRESIGGRGSLHQPRPMEENQEMKPCPLPAPTMSFYPPRQCHYYDGEMEFMLLGAKLVAAHKSTPASLTVDEDHLYVLGTVPGYEDRCFECLEFDRDGDEDGHSRVLPPPPYEYDPEMQDSNPGVDSYTAVGGSGSPRILVSKARLGTYSFDTAEATWSKAGDWTLPFSGCAEYVPEHGLWFGLRDDGPCTFCAVDLATTTMRRPPAVRNLWKDFTPPVEWTAFPPVSRLVHLGSARFCIARFFTTNPLASSTYPVTHAVFTAVEVERCDATDGGLRMVKHGSKLYTLLHEMIPWVL